MKNMLCVLFESRYATQSICFFSYCWTICDLNIFLCEYKNKLLSNAKWLMLKKSCLAPKRVYTQIHHHQIGHSFKKKYLIWMEVITWKVYLIHRQTKSLRPNLFGESNLLRKLSKTFSSHNWNLYEASTVKPNHVFNHIILIAHWNSGLVVIETEWYLLSVRRMRQRVILQASIWIYSDCFLFKETWHTNIYIYIDIEH